MKKKSRGITRRDFVKTGLIAGGVAATGLPIITGRILNAAPIEIKIGQLAPLTGVSAAWGQRSYWGFLLAADMINEQGGIKSMGGAKIKIVVADTESKPEIAGIQAEKLIGDKSILILSGTNQSAAGMVATQVAERSQICYITGVDGAPQITERGFQFTYRTCPIMTNYGKDLMYFAKEMGKKTGKAVKKVAILCENSIFGVSGGDAVDKYAKEVGFEVVDYSTYDAATTRDFTGYISKYKNAGVDFLACHNRSQDGMLIWRAMKELDFNPLGCGGVFGVQATSDFAEMLGKDVNHTFGSTNYSDFANITGFQEIKKEYKKRYKVAADTNMIAGFAVVAVLAATLEAHPTYDRMEFKKALDKIEIDTGEYNNLQINGVKWDKKHDNARVEAFVIQWKDGVQYPVFPASYAAKEAVWPRPTWDEISKGA